MRILLLADVHANQEALLSLQRAEPRPDAVLFAGDAVGYGPEPVYCLRWLCAHATLAVRGNHDQAALGQGLNGAPPELAEAAAQTLQLARRQLAPDDLDALGRWPSAGGLALGGARFHLVHGTPDAPFDGQLDPATCSEARLEELFSGLHADVIVLGHTHLPALRRFKDQLIVNPGSLGQPRYGTPDATYAVWEDGRVQIRHLHYDHGATARRLRLLSLDPEVAEQLEAVLESGLI